jgi:23S rRNA (adenine2503-C2)-methyltransferase
MNLIPYNATAALAYRRPSVERITELTRYLHAKGIRTTVRNSAGQDVDGGCGQLRARESARPLLRSTGKTGQNRNVPGAESAG